jgi:hypothetical protein
MSTASKAAGRNRLAAIVAMLLVVGVVAATVGRVADEPLRVAVEFLLVVLIVGGAWIALTTTKTREVCGGHHLAALASGHPDRFGGLSTWAAPTFDVTSDSPIEMGLDGETKVMDSPLRFSIRPTPVRVRFPKQATGYSPAARSIGWRKSLRRLWATALGTIST